MISITVDGVAYDVPSSAADANWAAQQVAFEQALATAVNSATTDVAALDAVVTALSAAVKPTAVVGTAGSGTGITGATTAYGRNVVHKITVDYTAVAFAGTTNDVTVWTLPAKTRVLRVIADVTAEFQGGAIASVMMTTGTASLGEELLLSATVSTSAVVLGDAQSELGTKVLGGAGFTGDVFWSAPTVVATFSSSGANLDDLSAGSVTFYVETCTYP